MPGPFVFALTSWRYVAPALLVLAPVAAGQTSPPDQPGECVAPGSQVALDHVVLAVPGLDPARDEAGRAGFTVKPGRPHSNGLHNAHLKLADGTSIELMASTGPPGDAMASEYARVLADGGGGAFLALKVERTLALAAARRVGLDALAEGDRLFRYVTFPAAGLAAVFAIEYPHPAADDPAVLRHANGATGTAEVWLEAGPELGHLLAALGAAPCGTMSGPGGLIATGFGVRNGAVVVMPIVRGARPRVLGLRLRVAGSAAPRAAGSLHGVWLEAVPSDPGGRS